jgi:hypothetical protein
VLREWQDGIYEELDKLQDGLRTHRERVAMLEGQLRAMVDLKGVPGKQGERGKQDERGSQGVTEPLPPRHGIMKRSMMPKAA